MSEDEKVFLEVHCPRCANKDKQDACELVRAMDGSIRCKGWEELPNS